jgi:cell division protease FtsH
LLEGRSCAELETVINQAATYAAFEKSSQVEMKHMIKAILRIVFKAPESFEQNEKALPIVACHEAGHALVAELLEPGSVSLVTALNHESFSGGVTSVAKDECYAFSKKLMENRIMYLLAGKAATEIYYETVDMGAKSDLARAFSIVYRFIDDVCSYGFNQFVCGGRSSNELLNRRDCQAAEEMDKYYKKTKQLILDNKNKLDALISRLIEAKTLIGDQVQQILNCA